MYHLNSKIDNEKYTRRIEKTPSGYIHRSSWHEENNRKYERKRETSTFGKDRIKMKKKLIRGIAALLLNQEIETREEMYSILLDRGFIPIIAQDKVLSFARFLSYYADVKKNKGIVFTRPTKTDYIRENYKKESVSSIASNIGSEEIFVRQTISKIKRGLI